MSDVSRLGDRATVGAWLATRTPPPPPLLRAHLEVALGAELERAVADTEQVCLEAAGRVLERLFDDGAADRHDAADLLAADALVTYALEYAADRPEGFDERAARAIERFGQMSQTRA